MYICKECKGKRIRTRVSKSYSKNVVSSAFCKDCGSSDVEKLSLKREKRFRR